MTVESFTIGQDVYSVDDVTTETIRLNHGKVTRVGKKAVTVAFWGHQCGTRFYPSRMDNEEYLLSTAGAKLFHTQKDASDYMEGVKERGNDMMHEMSIYQGAIAKWRRGRPDEDGAGGDVGASEGKPAAVVGDAGMLSQFPWNVKKGGTWDAHFRNRFERVE